MNFVSCKIRDRLISVSEAEILTKYESAFEKQSDRGIRLSQKQFRALVLPHGGKLVVKMNIYLDFFEIAPKKINLGENFFCDSRLRDGM